jgi:hypothetical protein
MPGWPPRALGHVLTLACPASSRSASATTRRADLDAVVAPPYDVPPRTGPLAGRDPHNVVVVDVPDGSGVGRYEAAGATFRQWLADGVPSPTVTPPTTAMP